MLVIFCITSTLNSVKAADKEQISNYQVELFNIDDGFNSSVVFSIVQDQQGFLWFGTGHTGIFRFDGKNVLKFEHNPDDINSLPHNNTGNLSIDNQGDLWVGSWGGGAIRYTPKDASFVQFKHQFTNPETISGSFVQKVYQDSQDEFWMGTFRNGLNKFHPESQTFQRYPFNVTDASGTSHERIWDIAQTDPHGLWIGTSYGLNYFDKRTQEFHHYIPFETVSKTVSNKIRDILVINEQQLLLATDNGPLLFNTTTKEFSLFQSQDQLVMGEIYSLIKTSFGEIWLSSSNGIFSVNIHSLTLKKVQLTIDDQCSQTLFSDQGGTIWLSCEGVGIYKITTNQTFKTISNPTLRFSYNVFASNNDKILIKTQNEGIVELDPSSQALSLLTPVKRPRTPNGIFFQRKNNDIFYNTGSTLYRLTPGSPLEKVAPPPSFKYAHLFHNFLHMKEDQHGTLWVVTTEGLFFINQALTDFQFTDFQFLSPEKSANTDLKYKHANTIYRDHDNNIWLGSPYGLHLWQEEQQTFQHYNFATVDIVDSPENFVNVLFEDSQKRFWVGTDEGLLLLDRVSGEITRYNQTIGLASKFIKSIAENKSGELWLMSDIGLSRFNPETLAVTNYDQRDGLPAARFYLYFAQITDGLIFFASREGLHYFDPNKKEQYNSNAQTVLTNFDILSSETPSQKYSTKLSSLALASDENYIRFEFTTVDLHHAKQINYSYILEGYDHDWINNGTSNSVIYNNLSGGNYTLKVKASYRENAWYPNQLILPVQVATPWWLTWWMLTFYIIAVLLAIYYYIHRKGQQQQHEIERQKYFVLQLEQQVAEKTADIKLESEKLMLANKVKSQFLANMSHEIRTPMNAVIGLTSLALKHESDAQQSDYLHKIKESSESLLSLLNDILDLSKIEANKLSLECIAFDLHELIKKAVNVCIFKIQEKQLEFVVNLAPDVSNQLFGDPLRLKQILINLLNNAVKFTKKGAIYINIETISRKNTETELQFTITDTGIGMTGAQQQRLFQAFSQADDSVTREYGGTGLGLAICKQLIELMSGSITVKSQIGKGSVFIFSAKFKLKPTMPYTQIIEHENNTVMTTSALLEKETKRLTPPQGKLADNELPLQFSQYTALLVEDNLLNQQIAKAFLADTGIQVDTAENGEIALTKIKQNHYDIVFMDIQMPIMDGLTAVEKIRKELKLLSLPIIAMTAHAMDGDAEKSQEVGMNEHLTKPISPERIHKTLSTYLN